ncbi:hypothetical protein GF338_11875 [candidate division WOR-3 bacterium]|nr:hypothetical protein [candidate division WOR-3 bacterium]
MLNCTRILSLVLFLAAFASCDRRIKWENYTSQEAGFSALFPGKVKERIETISTIDRGMIDNHYFTVEKSYGTFVVSYLYAPEN